MSAVPDIVVFQGFDCGVKPVMNSAQVSKNKGNIHA